MPVVTAAVILTFSDSLHIHTCMHQQTNIQRVRKLHPDPNLINLPLSDMIWSPFHHTVFPKLLRNQSLLTTVVPHMQLFRGLLYSGR